MKPLSNRFLKFLVVGASNAALHFTILNICYNLIHLNAIVSSLVATVCAMAYSFLLNKNYVFQSPAAIKQEVFRFVAVTASGVLIVHNLVYIFFLYILNHNITVVSLIEETINYRISQDSIVVNLATVAGAIVALIWNYNGYRFFVFKNSEINYELKSQQ